MADPTLHPALASLLAEGERTGWLHLSKLNITEIPRQVFQLKNLVRLDLGYNLIHSIPSDIGKLSKLEQLWINNNPIKELPKELGLCRSLQVIDARNTMLQGLPTELGKLVSLIEIDIRGVKLPQQYIDACQEGTASLLRLLSRLGERTKLMQQLGTTLRNGKYREISDSEKGQIMVEELVAKMFSTFTDPEEQKNLIRNAERLFPEDISHANPVKIKETFVSLRRENEMKKLSAELELKLRQIYFDAINPAHVEGIVKGVYSAITKLEDIQFLIRYAKLLFPSKSSDIDPLVVRQNMLEMQAKMAAERAAALASLTKMLRGHYESIEPERVLALVDHVAPHFKKVEDIKKLTADAGVFFPAEFDQAVPKNIKAKFVEEKRAAEALLSNEKDKKKN